MSFSLRLKIIQFLQFFVWGAWLITAGSYMGGTLHFTGLQIGSVYAAMGMASIFAPGIMGIISDKWIPANYLYILCHIVGAICLFLVTQTTNYELFYTIMVINLLAYMPTIALSYSVCYACFEKENIDPVQHFPSIRVWGTIGFICAMWLISLAHLSENTGQFYVASAASVLLCVIVYFVIPKLDVAKKDANEIESLASRFGLNSFVLFKDSRMATFFLFTMLLGIILQISNTWADPFLKSFGATSAFADSLVVRYSTIIVSLSQISEVCFILLVPFFLKKFGIKYIILISILAWFLRFGFFAIGGPEGIGFAFIILSMIVYGCAFDFFNISCSIYVETTTDPKIRNSAQGLFMSISNGVGGFIGSYAAGLVVDFYSRYDGDQLISRNWTNIWSCFALYALVLAAIFFFVFRHRKDGL